MSSKNFKNFKKFFVYLSASVLKSEDARKFTEIDENKRNDRKKIENTFGQI